MPGLLSIAKPAAAPSRQEDAPAPLTALQQALQVASARVDPATVAKQEEEDEEDKFVPRYDPHESREGKQRKLDIAAALAAASNPVSMTLSKAQDIIAADDDGIENDPSLLGPDDDLEADIAPQETVDVWAQCSTCEKWHVLPEGWAAEDLPEEFTCSMEPIYADCNEDLDDDDDDDDEAGVSGLASLAGISSAGHGPSGPRSPKLAPAKKKAREASPTKFPAPRAGYNNLQCGYCLDILQVPKRNRGGRGGGRQKHMCACGGSAQDAIQRAHGNWFEYDPHQKNNGLVAGRRYVPQNKQKQRNVYMEVDEDIEDVPYHPKAGASSPKSYRDESTERSPKWKVHEQDVEQDSSFLAVQAEEEEEVEPPEGALQCGYCYKYQVPPRGSSGRLKMQCKCGGSNQDGKARMHTNWFTPDAIKEQREKGKLTFGQRLVPGGQAATKKKMVKRKKPYGASPSPPDKKAKSVRGAQLCYACERHRQGLSMCTAHTYDEGCLRAPPVHKEPVVYECEHGCGFEDTNEAVVERHESTCTYHAVGLAGATQRQQQAQQAETSMHAIAQAHNEAEATRARAQQKAQKQAMLQAQAFAEAKRHEQAAASLEMMGEDGGIEALDPDADEGEGEENPQPARRYWSVDEHNRFLEAMKTLSKSDHIAIANFVGTRNAIQVRTHAQKHFLALSRGKSMHLLANDRYRKMYGSDPDKLEASPSEASPSATEPSGSVRLRTERDRTSLGPQRCVTCGESSIASKMLICDSCERGYHPDCMRPAQAAIPPGFRWYCDDCGSGLPRSYGSISSFKHIYPYGGRWRFKLKVNRTRMVYGIYDSPMLAARALKIETDYHHDCVTKGVQYGANFKLKKIMDKRERHGEIEYQVRREHEEECIYEEAWEPASNFEINNKRLIAFQEQSDGGAGAVSLAGAGAEYECEFGCGFDSSDVRVVEQHERTCPVKGVDFRFWRDQPAKSCDQRYQESCNRFGHKLGCKCHVPAEDRDDFGDGPDKGSSKPLAVSAGAVHAVAGTATMPSKARPFCNRYGHHQSCKCHLSHSAKGAGAEKSPDVPASRHGKDFAPSCNRRGHKEGCQCHTTHSGAATTTKLESPAGDPSLSEAGTAVKIEAVMIEEFQIEELEYECEHGCGFDSTNKIEVEEHEKTCKGPGAIPASSNGVMVNDAVSVKWTAKKHFQAIAIETLSGGKVRIQFDGTWKKATVPASSVKPLKEAAAEDLPEGYAMGDRVLAQDPFDENPDKWHNAVILSARHGTKVKSGVEVQISDGDEDKEFRFWVRFEVDSEANCQWVGLEHLKPYSEEGLLDDAESSREDDAKSRVQSPPIEPEKVAC